MSFKETFEDLGLTELCDVCGAPLLRDQKLGRKKSNDALCHEDCLYYKIGNTIVSKEKYNEHIIKSLSGNATI